MSSKKLQISKNTAQTAKRLLKYVTETYKLRFFLVFICIFISSGASISVSLSLKFLLDDFIIPLIGQQTPDFAGLYRRWERWPVFSLRVYLPPLPIQD